MINYLSKHPSKILNRIFLIGGLLVLCPLYTLNLFLVNQVFNTETLTRLLTSFNTHIFREIILSVSQNGQLDNLFLVYIVNIITLIGFMFTFFSITIIIARSLNTNSRLYKIAFIFPILSIIIAVFDILPSIILLIVIKNMNHISDFTTYFINGSYIFRVLLLYIVFIWIIVMGIVLFVRNIRKRVQTK